MTLTNGSSSQWAVIAFCHPLMPPVLRPRSLPFCQKTATWSNTSWISTSSASTFIDLSFYATNSMSLSLNSTLARCSSTTQVSYVQSILYSHSERFRSSTTVHVGSIGKPDPNPERAPRLCQTSISRPSCHLNGPSMRLSSSAPLPSSLSFESRLAACKHSFFCTGICILRYTDFSLTRAFLIF